MDFSAGLILLYHFCGGCQADSPPAARVPDSLHSAAAAAQPAWSRPREQRAHAFLLGHMERAKRGARVLKIPCELFTSIPFRHTSNTVARGLFCF